MADKAFLPNTAHIVTLPLFFGPTGCYYPRVSRRPLPYARYLRSLLKLVGLDLIVNSLEIIADNVLSPRLIYFLVHIRHGSRVSLYWGCRVRIKLLSHFLITVRGAQLIRILVTSSCTSIITPNTVSHLWVTLETFYDTLSFHHYLSAVVIILG